MLSLVVESKRIRQMLSHVWSNSLILRFILRTFLREPFSVFMPVSESILTKTVFHYCLVFINHKNNMVNLVELGMVDFCVILCMDWLHACYASVDCRSWGIKFQFQNEPVLKLTSSSAMPKGHFISYLKARNLVSKACVYHLVWLNDSNVGIPLV